MGRGNRPPAPRRRTASHNPHDPARHRNHAPGEPPRTQRHKRPEIQPQKPARGACQQPSASAPHATTTLPNGTIQHQTTTASDTNGTTTKEATIRGQKDATNPDDKRRKNNQGTPATTKQANLGKQEKNGTTQRKKQPTNTTSTRTTTRTNHVQRHSTHTHPNPTKTPKNQQQPTPKGQGTTNNTPKLYQTKKQTKHKARQQQTTPDRPPPPKPTIHGEKRPNTHHAQNGDAKKLQPSNQQRQPMPNGHGKHPHSRAARRTKPPAQRPQRAQQQAPTTRRSMETTTPKAQAKHCRRRHLQPRAGNSRHQATGARTGHAGSGASNRARTRPHP